MWNWRSVGGGGHFGATQKTCLLRQPGAADCGLGRRHAAAGCHAAGRRGPVAAGHESTRRQAARPLKTCLNSSSRADALVLRLAVHQVDQVHALGAVEVALVHDVTLTCPGSPLGSGGLRSLIADGDGPIFSSVVRFDRKVREHRRLWMWLGEIPARHPNAASPKTSDCRRRTCPIAFPDICPQSLSASASSTTSARVYTRPNRPALIPAVRRPMPGPRPGIQAARRPAASASRLSFSPDAGPCPQSSSNDRGFTSSSPSSSVGQLCDLQPASNSRTIAFARGNSSVGRAQPCQG